MLPKNLSDILENYDPEDFEIAITKIGNEISNFKFDIQISVSGFNDEDNFVRDWTIETKQYRASKIFLDRASTFEVSSDHPILWQFSDIQSSIYFSGHCSNVDKLFIGLYRTHKSLFEDFLLFENTINQPSSFEKLISSTNGLLGNGPKKLLIEYGNILEQFNLNYSIIGDRVPTYWDGEKHVPESGNAKVLFIDSSYIIADEFQFVT